MIRGSVATRAAIAGATATLIAACSGPLLATPRLDAVVRIQVEAAHSVDVRWTGTSSGQLTIDACAQEDVALAPGQYTFDLRGDRQAAQLPVEVHPGDRGIVDRIGVGPDGAIGFGEPVSNPRCAAT